MLRLHTMRRLLPLVLGLLVTEAAGAQGSPGTVLAGATVIDVERGVAIPRQDIVIRGDRIVAVRPTGSAPAPRGARIIRAEGRFVIPGLWDMHTHLFADPAAAPQPALDFWKTLSRDYYAGLLIAAGVTGVRDLGGDLDQYASWLAAAPGPEEAPLPRMSVTGHKLGAEPVVPGAPFPIRNAEDVRRSVQMLRARGGDDVKLAPEQPAWLVREALAACRDMDMPCVAHVPDSLDAHELTVGGLKSLEHLFLWIDNTSSLSFDEVMALRRLALRPTLLERVAMKLGLKPHPSAGAADTAYATHSPAKAAELFGALAKAGVWMTPTLTLHDIMQRATPRHAAARDTSLMTERARPQPAPTQPELRHSARRWAEFTTLVREMRDAGVGLLAGTDIPLRSVPGASVHMELELLQRAGLTPIEALRTATLNPARYFGALDSLGTVAAGKVADLVVLRANPLDDVSAVGQVALVVRAGRVFTRDEIDRFVERSRLALRRFREAEDRLSPEPPE